MKVGDKVSIQGTVTYVDDTHAVISISDDADTGWVQIESANYDSVTVTEAAPDEEVETETEAPTPAPKAKRGKK